jgi:hypothetical protein
MTRKRTGRITRGPSCMVPFAMDFPGLEAFARAEPAPGGGKTKRQFGSTRAPGSARAPLPITAKTQSSCLRLCSGWAEGPDLGGGGFVSEPLLTPHELSQRARASLTPEVDWWKGVPEHELERPPGCRSGHGRVRTATLGTAASQSGRHSSRDCDVSFGASPNLMGVRSIARQVYGQSVV